MHNNITNFVNEVHCGDCKDVMAQFPDDCIDLTITSPLTIICGLMAVIHLILRLDFKIKHITLSI